jgi:endonuclease III
VGEMRTNEPTRTLIRELGERFSKKLRIDLETKKSSEIFKWFLASILFAARITEKIALNTYREFEARNLLTPSKILKMGWDGLVEVLDEGGYVRYDFKTATKLLEVMGTLEKRYEGDLNNLHKAASDSRDLEEILMNLGKGVGPVTVSIFLRELRGIWEKADPMPQELVIQASKNLGFTKLAGKDEKERLLILKQLENVWRQSGISKGSFIDLEAALVRLGRDFCRKKRCKICPVAVHCEYQKSVRG